MSWIDNVKGFVSNAGSKVSSFVSNVFSTGVNNAKNYITSEKNVYTTPISTTAKNIYTDTKNILASKDLNVALSHSEKLFDDIFESKLVSPVTRNVVYPLNKAHIKAWGQFYPYLIESGTGSAIYLTQASKFSRTPQRRDFLNSLFAEEPSDSVYDQRIQKANDIMNQLGSAGFSYSDYLQRMYGKNFSFHPQTYDQQKTFIDDYTMILNKEYVINNIAQVMPSLEIMATSAYVGGGPLRAVTTGIITGAEPYTNRLREIKDQEGKKYSDATLEDLIYGGVIGGVNTAIEYLEFSLLGGTKPKVTGGVSKTVIDKVPTEVGKRLVTLYPYISQYIRSTLGIAGAEGIGEALQEVIPRIAHYLVYDPERTWEDFRDTELDPMIKSGKQAFALGSLGTLPFAAFGQFVTTKNSMIADQIYRDSVIGAYGDYDVTLSKLAGDQFMEGDHVNQGMLIGRTTDIIQKLEAFGISSDVAITAARPLVEGQFATYADYASAAKTMISSVLTGEGISGSPNTIITESLVGDEKELQVVKFVQRQEETGAVEATLSTEIPQTSEYTTDTQLYANADITGVADVITENVLETAEYITDEETPTIVDTTQQAVNDALNTNTTNIDRFTVRATDQTETAQSYVPTDVVISFDRTNNGEDVVSSYDVVNGELFINDVLTLDQAQNKFGTTDKQEIASQMSGIVNNIVSDGFINVEQSPVFQEEQVPQQYSEAASYARRISQYQRLLNTTRGTLQQNLIKQKIRNFEKQRRSVVNQKLIDTFVTTDAAKSAIKSIEFLKNVSLVEVQNMIETKSGVAYGSYAQAIISFVKNPHETTLPHEAFHAFVDLVMTDQEKHDAFDLVKNEYNIAHDFEAEEKLAQLFAEYFVTTKFPKTKIGRILQRIGQLMREFIGIVPEIEKIFGKVTSPFVTQRLKYVEGMNKYMPEFLDKMQENAMIESTRMFTDKFFLRKEFQKNFLLGKLESRKLRVSEPVRFLMMSVLTSTEFANQKIINTMEFKKAVSAKTMKIERIEANSFTQYGFGNVGLTGLDNKRIILNTNFGHGKKGHFSDKFDAVTKKEDIEIRHVPAGTHTVNGETQTLEKDMYGVIRKDVRTQEDLEEIGAFAVFDTEQEALEYVNTFEDRPTYIPGLFGHYAIGFDITEDGKKVATINEIQSDTLKEKLLKQYIRSSERLKKSEIDSSKKYYNEIMQRYREKLSLLNNITDQDIQIMQSNADNINAFIDNIDNLEVIPGDEFYALLMQETPIGSLFKITVIDDSINTIRTMRDQVKDKYTFKSLRKNLSDIKAAYDNSIRLNTKFLNYNESERDKSISKINDKYGKEGQYFFKENSENIGYLNSILKNTDFLNEAIQYSIARRSNLLSPDIYKWITELPLKVDKDLFNDFVSDYQGLNEAQFEFYQQYDDTKFREILKEHIPKKIAELENVELTDAQREEIALSEQFMSFVQDYYKVIIDDAIRYAAQNGAQEIGFTSDYTLAKFEGWSVSELGYDDDESGIYTSDEVEIGMDTEDFGRYGYVIDVRENEYSIVSSESPITQAYISDYESDAVDMVYEDPTYVSAVTNGKYDDRDLKERLIELALGDKDVIASFKDEMEEGDNVEDLITDDINNTDIDYLLSSSRYEQFDADIRDYATELVKDDLDIETWIEETSGYVYIDGDTVYRSESEIYNYTLNYRNDGDALNEENYDAEEHLIDEGKAAITKAYNTFFRPYFIKNRKKVGTVERRELNGYYYDFGQIVPNDHADVALFQTAKTVTGTEQYQQEVETPMVNRRIPTALVDSKSGAKVFNTINNVITDGLYPENIPADLRRRQLFAKMRQYILDDTYPVDRNVREVRLYDIIHNMMRKEAGFPELGFTSTEDEFIVRPTVEQVPPPPPITNPNRSLNANLKNKIRAAAYETFAQEHPNAQITPEQAAAYVKKITNDLKMDTTTKTTGRELQLIDASISDLNKSLSAVQKEMNSISSYYLQQISYVNETFKKGDYAPRAYKALQRKLQRKATNEELQSIVDDVIKEVAIEGKVDNAIRYQELQNSENVLTRLIDTYTESKKTAKEGRLARYMMLLKERTNLLSIISEMKRFTRQLPQVKQAQNDLTIAKESQDKDYRTAFTHLTKEQRFAYDLSVVDFVQMMKDTYLIETKEGRVKFVDGKFVDNEKKNGATVKYSLAQRGQREGYDSVDAYLSDITINQKVIDDLNQKYKDIFNAALQTPEYIRVIQELNSKERRMDLISATFADKNKFLLSIRALELKAMRDMAYQNKTHEINQTIAKLKHDIAIAKKEGREDLKNYKDELAIMNDKKYQEKLRRKAIIASYQKTYKFITTDFVNTYLSRYLRSAGENTNLYTMPLARFESILAKNFDPLIEDAVQKFALAKQRDDLISEREITHAENVKRALKLKDKISSIGKDFTDITATQLRDSDLADMAEYYDILSTVLPQSEILPERIIEKAMRNGMRPGIDLNVFITEKDYVEARRRANNMTEADAYAELNMRRKKGYSKLDKIQGLTHVSDTDIYTSHITEIMLEMELASKVEYEEWRKEFQRRYRIAVASRRKSLFHTAMASTKRFFFGDKTPDTDMLVFDFLDARDRSKTPAESIAMSQIEKKAVTDALLLQMTPQEQALALWMRKDLYEDGSFIHEYEGTAVKEYYITHARRRFKDFYKQAGLFKGFYKYVTQKEEVAEKNVFTDISQDIRENVYISTQHIFNYAKRRYLTEETSTDIVRLMSMYKGDLSRHKQFLFNIPRIASMVDIIMLDSEINGRATNKDNILGFWRDHMKQLRGSYEYTVKKYGTTYKFLRGIDWYMNMKFLFGRMFIQTIAPISDIIAIYRDINITYGLIDGHSRFIRGITNYLRTYPRRYLRRIHPDREITNQFQLNTEKLEKGAIGLIERTIFDDIISLDKSLLKKVEDIFLLGYGLTFPELNRAHLHMLFTKKELDTGEYEPGSLAKYAKSMSRMRYMHGMKSTSPIGSTIEGRIATKYITWALPESMIETNLSRNILMRKIPDEIRKLAGKQQQYPSTSWNLIRRDALTVATGMLQVSLMFYIFMQLIENHYLPEDQEDDTPIQKKIRRIMSESSSAPAGLVTIGSRMYLFASSLYNTFGEEGEKSELAFVNRNTKGKLEMFTQAFRSFGTTGIPLLDTVNDAMIQVAVLYMRSLPFGHIKEASQDFGYYRRMSSEQKKAFDEANYNLFSKIMPIMSSTAVRTNIGSSKDGKYYPFNSSFGITIPFLTAKEQDRDLSEELFGHRFGLNDEQKKAYEIYKKLDGTDTASRVKYASQLIDNKDKDVASVGRQLRIMIANENFTKEEKNILAGATRIYYASVENEKMTDGFRGYSLKLYTDSIQSASDKEDFIKRVHQHYVASGIMNEDALNAYFYLEKSHISFTNTEERFYTTPSFHDERAINMIEYVNAQKSWTHQRRVDRLIEYEFAGMMDVATQQDIIRAIKGDEIK